jgi:hypothetical protein
MEAEDREGVMPKPLSAAGRRNSFKTKAKNIVIARSPALAGRRGNLMRLLHFVRNDILSVDVIRISKFEFDTLRGRMIPPIVIKIELSVAGVGTEMV